MIRRLEFTQAARAELDGIIDYSIETFGRRVADNYLDRLEVAFETIKRFPDLGTRYQSAEISYRRFRAQRHYIYYLFNEETLTVARIVHIRQNQEKALRR